MKKTFTTILDRFNSDLWHYHLVVPEEVSDFFNARKIKRLICTIDHLEPFQCALMPKGGNQYFININQERRKRLGLQLGDEVQLGLEQDQSKYGLPMPEELETLLKMDDVGNRIFHALTPGKQRNLLFIAGKPKTSDTRLSKSLVIVDYLKKTGVEINFRELLDALSKGPD